MPPGHYLGLIKSFEKKKGFGFIDCPETYQQFGRDVFIHKKDMGNFKPGIEVTFAIAMNKDGHPQARDVVRFERMPVQEFPPGPEAHYLGLIKKFDGERGFGFIDCPEAKHQFGRDVFIHKNQMCDMDVGTEVAFYVEVNKNGHPQARDVVKAEAMQQASRDRGVITKYDDEKGYGFIDCPRAKEYFGMDVFLHKNDVGIHEVGAVVTFLVETNKKGQPQARDVQAAGEEEAHTAAPAKDTRYVGLIHKFDADKGFGFIDCPEARASFGRDVFIHKKQMNDGLENGTEVSFLIVRNKRGNPQARSVVRAGEEPPAENEDADGMEDED